MRVKVVLALSVLKHVFPNIQGDIAISSVNLKCVLSHPFGKQRSRGGSEGEAEGPW